MYFTININLCKKLLRFMINNLMKNESLRLIKSKVSKYLE